MRVHRVSPGFHGARFPRASRPFRLDAVIVRVMKSRKTMEHRQLIMEVVELLKGRFQPSPEDIKKRIESLIEREYMERSQQTRCSPHVLRALRGKALQKNHHLSSAHLLLPFWSWVPPRNTQPCKLKACSFLGLRSTITASEGQKCK